MLEITTYMPRVLSEIFAMHVYGIRMLKKNSVISSSLPALYSYEMSNVWLSHYLSIKLWIVSGYQAEPSKVRNHDKSDVAYVETQP